MLPGRIIHRSGQQEDSITLTAAMRVTGEIVRWRMPAPDPESAVFDPNANRTVEIKSVMNLIFIRPRIDGQDIGWFFLDTGADAMCLDSAVAKRLGLPVIGSDTVAGAVGVSHLQICRGSTFQVGPLTLKQPVFLALDLAPFAQLLKLPIVGICGYDFLARVALDIDLKASTLRMFPPGKAALPEGASWSRIWFESNTPGVYCRFEGGRRGFFTLDTGSNETVDFFSPAVVRFRLLENRKVNSARTGGAGGVTESKTGALDWFELGGTRIEKPLVGFQTAQEGIFSNPYRVGNIGMGLLGRFRLILDYAHERIAFISPENAADKAE
jgi:hypothetical protein